jgi:hypothetical protein
LEEVLLSAFLLQNSPENGERIFADVPWWERSRKSDNKAKINRAEERSIVILGVPEGDENIDINSQKKHDFLQWRYLSDILKANEVAVVDTFRIPKSQKYMGAGPRPLKLTFLRGEMLDILKTQWRQNRNLLPRELKISSSTRTNKPADASNTNAGEPITSDPAKNDPAPTSTESATL